MGYIGNTNKSVNTRTVIDHQNYTVLQSDRTNSGFYTFFVNYTPGNLSVFVKGVALAESDYTANNGKDVRIPTTIPLSNEDDVEIIGYTVPATSILERSDVNITAGTIGGLRQMDSRLYLNDSTYTEDLTIDTGKNAFIAGPINFTATLNVAGTLNII